MLTMEEVITSAIDSYKSGPPKILEPAMLDRHLVELGGLFWYRCELSEDSPSFPSGERGRIGWVLIVPTIAKRELAIDLVGVRLAALQEDSSTRIIEPHMWQGKGRLEHDFSGVVFAWSSSQAEGKTEELVQVDFKENRWQGKFTQELGGNETVRGQVEYLRITDGNQIPMTSGTRWVSSELEPNFEQHLGASNIVRWGSRILEASEAPEKIGEDNLVVLDIVSRSAVTSLEEDLLRNRRELVEKYRNVALFIAREDAQPMGRFSLRGSAGD